MGRRSVLPVNHHRYQASVVHLPSRYLALSSQTNCPSVHITNIIGKCSQTLYALTILRAHGLCDTALQSVYGSVVVARLYACNAWWGFTTSADRQRLASFVGLRRGVRRGFCSPDLINIDSLVSDMDDKLFYSILKKASRFTLITSSRTF